MANRETFCAVLGEALFIAHAQTQFNSRLAHPQILMSDLSQLSTFQCIQC